MTEQTILKCPVCKARFRSETLCSRCGSDLAMLMKTAAKAFLLRQKAREEIFQGNLSNAFNLIARALKHKDQYNFVK